MSSFRVNDSIQGVILTALLLLFTSCEKPDERKGGEPDTPDSASQSVPVAPSAKPLRAEERESATEFCLQFENAIEMGDTEYLTDQFDFSEVIKNVSAGNPIPVGAQKGMEMGVTSAIENIVSLLVQAKLDFIELKDDRGTPVGLFRIRRDDGLDYVEYRLSPATSGEGNWRVSDAYAYSVGMRMSDLLQTIIVPMLREMEPNLLERILDKRIGNNAMVEAMPKIREMQILAQQGKGQEALAIWPNIPSSVKQKKFVLFIYLQAASLTDDAISEGSDYFQAMERFEKLFPNDPSMDLISIDLYLIRNDLPRVYESIDALQTKISDPYLEFYQSYVKIIEEDFEGAETLAREWIDEAPSDDEGWQVLLEVAFATGQNDLMAESIAVLENEFGWDYSGIIEDPEFEDFVDSPEGKNWISNR